MPSLIGRTLTDTPSSLDKTGRMVSLYSNCLQPLLILQNGLTFHPTALALCEWSDIHTSRRSIAHAAVIPRFGTVTFQRLSESIESSVNKLLFEISQSLSLNGDGTAVMEKDRLLRMCGAIFVEFLLEKEV